MILNKYCFFLIILIIFPFLLFARNEGHPGISEDDLKTTLPFWHLIHCRGANLARRFRDCK